MVPPTRHNSVPAHATVLVIGGGPAGSFAAATLAREGIAVVLLEAARFPRYHIGESMLPSIRPFLKFVGAEEKVKKHGFTIKPGAAIKFNQYKHEGYTDFIAVDPENGSWNVIRSELDEILLRHAQECGAAVFEEHKVLELHFAPGSEHRPVSATYARPGGGSTGSIAFDYLIDASGRTGLMSTKYLHNRTVNASLRNVACWGYWTGAGTYRPGTNRENAPYFEALTDESGWGWFIPLHNGTVSVGIVMDGATSTAKKAEGTRVFGNHTLKDHYLQQLDFVPGLRALLGSATLHDDGTSSVVRAASDYSYAASSYSGDHFRLAGDASAFIDPFFSSGVHLAYAGGLTAAISIAASIRGHCSEEEAAAFHDIKVGVSYTRFLLVVMGAYKQIRAQTVPVLSDIDEDNYDRAFEIIRPVIQGTADVGKKLTEDELQKTMDFVQGIFAPTDPEMRQAVGARLDKGLLSPDAPIITEEQVKDTVGSGDEEATHVLNQINASKVVKPIYTDGPGDLALDGVNGLVACMKVGSLGLVRFIWNPIVPRHTVLHDTKSLTIFI